MAAASNGTAIRPGQLTPRERELRSAFLAEVDRIPGGDRLRRCIQCGTCSGSCPVSYAMDVQPRQLVAYFRAGSLDTILRSRTIWLCASCYACTVRCPAGIKVTDLIYGLKRMALETRIPRDRRPVAVLSREFVRVIHERGRNDEMRLLLRYCLRVSPRRLWSMIPLGWRLLRAGRFPWGTGKVRGLKGLRRLIAKAEAMETVGPRALPQAMGTIGYGVVAERPAAAAGGAGP
jgi:heterodisulfide reductase subunit C